MYMYTSQTVCLLNLPLVRVWIGLKSTTFIQHYSSSQYHKLAHLLLAICRCRPPPPKKNKHCYLHFSQVSVKAYQVLLVCMCV